MDVFLRTITPMIDVYHTDSIESLARKLCLYKLQRDRVVKETGWFYHSYYYLTTWGGKDLLVHFFFRAFPKNFFIKNVYLAIEDVGYVDRREYREISVDFNYEELLIGIGILTRYKSFIKVNEITTILS